MADPEVDAAVRLAGPATFAVALLLLLTGVAGLSLAAPTSHAAAPRSGSPLASGSSSALHGNISGPSILGTTANGTFRFNASGGPGFVGVGIVGKVTWKATLGGANTTGSTVTPANGTITSVGSEPVTLSVKTGTVRGSFTLTVTVTSSLGSNNSTLTLTASYQVILPYILRATLVTGPSAEVLPFKVMVALDGTVVGSQTVPKIAPNSTYDFAFHYASASLASGYHTFTLTIADAHGLVTFTNGKTVISTTFYIAPPTPDYLPYYVLGVVAFFGVLFIYATRVAARRRGTARR